MLEFIGLWAVGIVIAYGLRAIAKNPSYEQSDYKTIYRVCEGLFIAVLIAAVLDGMGLR